MPKRGDRVAPPSAPGEWQLRFAETAAATGWEALCQQAPGPTRTAYDTLLLRPMTPTNPRRQHRLRGDLGSRLVGGQALEQWQLEVTGAGRVWYAVDPGAKRVWVTRASPGHPPETD